jgi:ADP-Ribosyltransferase in polyvalent proteins
MQYEIVRNGDRFVVRAVQYAAKRKPAPGQKSFGFKGGSVSPKSDCGTGAGGFHRGNTCASGPFRLKAGAAKHAAQGKLFDGKTPAIARAETKPVHAAEVRKESERLADAIAHKPDLVPDPDEGAIWRVTRGEYAGADPGRESTGYSAWLTKRSDHRAAVIEAAKAGKDIPEAVAESYQREINNVRRYGVANPESWQLSEADFLSKKIASKIKEYEQSVAWNEDAVKKLGPKATAKREELERHIAWWKEAGAKLKADGPSQGDRERWRDEYVETIRKAISKGIAVPEDVIAQRPEFRKAKTARQTYEKGRHTSFANESVAINAQTVEEHGFKTKRQDGKAITPQQVAEITTGIKEIEKVFGPLDDVMRKGKLTIAHTNGKHPFLSDAGGLFSSGENTISVGISDMLGRPVRALAHELAHYVDYEAGRAQNKSTSVGKGKRSASLAEADGPYHSLTSSARSKINHYREAMVLTKAKQSDAASEEGKAAIERSKVQLGSYWREPREIFARLIEQYISTKLDGEAAVAVSKDYTNLPGWWSKADFEKLMPDVEREMTRRLEIIRGSGKKPEGTEKHARSRRLEVVRVGDLFVIRYAKIKAAPGQGDLFGGGREAQKSACGAGPGGFQSGNTCAKGAGSSQEPKGIFFKPAPADAPFSLKSDGGFGNNGKRGQGVLFSGARGAGSDLDKAVAQHGKGQTKPLEGQSSFLDEADPEKAKEAKIKDWKANGVRSKPFKDWFGDWEGDPANASKVVNKQGEPQETHGTAKKVFHGTRADFESFSKQKIGTHATHAGNGFYFAENPTIAAKFASDNYKKGGAGETPRVIEAYLSIKKPLDLDAPATRQDIDKWADIADAHKGSYSGSGKFQRKNFLEDLYGLHDYMSKNGGQFSIQDVWKALSGYMRAGTDEVNDVVKAGGYDGLTHRAADTNGTMLSARAHHEGYGRVWIAFEPNQIKATDNAGTFDPADDRIRYAIVPRGDLYSIVRYEPHPCGDGGRVRGFHQGNACAAASSGGSRSDAMKAAVRATIANQGKPPRSLADEPEGDEPVPDFTRKTPPTRQALEKKAAWLSGETARRRSALTPEERVQANHLAARGIAPDADTHGAPVAGYLKALDQSIAAKRAAHQARQDEAKGRRQSSHPKSPSPAEPSPPAAPTSPEATKRPQLYTPEARKRLAEKLKKSRAKKANAPGSTERNPSRSGDHPSDWAGWLVPSVIEADKDRFQFKLGSNAAGGVGSIEASDPWDRNRAGTVQVWRDPANGQTYVVNGHNRLEKAKKKGAKAINATYVEAANSDEAMTIGALTNISEGNGTPIDAAKFFKAKGITREKIAESGITFKKQVGEQGLALSTLADPLFRRVIDGDIAVARAAIIGGSGLSAEDQMKLAAKVEEKAKRKGYVTDSKIQEWANQIKDSVKSKPVGDGQGNLFGDDPEEESHFFHKSDLVDAIKKDLSQNKRLFKAVSTSKNAAKLQTVGNVINAEQSGKVSAEAAAILAIIDQQAYRSGPVSRILDQAAARMARGEKLGAVQKDVSSQVAEAVINYLEGTDQLTAA